MSVDVKESELPTRGGGAQDTDREPAKRLVNRVNYYRVVVLLTGLSLIAPAMILVAGFTKSEVLAWRTIGILPLQICIWVAWLAAMTYGMVRKTPRV